MRKTTIFFFSCLGHQRERREQGFFFSALLMLCELLMLSDRHTCVVCYLLLFLFVIICCLSLFLVCQFREGWPSGGHVFVLSDGNHGCVINVGRLSAPAAMISGFGKRFTGQKDSKEDHVRKRT
jgi:hypothetical protein